MVRIGSDRMMMKPNQLLMPRRALAGAVLPLLGLAPLPSGYSKSRQSYFFQ
jgi:hypothetical protein